MKEKKGGGRKKEERKRVGRGQAVHSTRCLVFKRALFKDISKEHFKEKSLTFQASQDAVTEMHTCQ